MMATKNICVRVDEELKRKAEELFDDLGMNLTSAIVIFLKSAVRCDGIPFEVTRAIPNEVTRKALSEDAEMRTNKKKYKRYQSFDEAVKEVLADET